MIGLVFSLIVSVSAVEVTSADVIQSGGRTYRIYDVDAPQLGASCRRERERAEETASFVRNLVANARRIEIVPGYDPRGRQSWPRDHVGRRLANILIDGRDLGEVLMQQGRAVPWNNSQTFNWCARRDPDTSRRR